MLLYIIIHVSLRITFTLYSIIFSFSLSRFGSKIVVQSANVKTTEVLPAEVKEVSHEPKHITLSAYKMCLFMYHHLPPVVIIELHHVLLCYNKQLYNIDFFLFLNAAYIIKPFSAGIDLNRLDVRL